jgi:hypothetical protein
MFWDTLLRLLFLLLVATGGVPFCLYLVARIERGVREGISVGSRWLLLILFWCALNISLGLVVGALQQYRAMAVFLGELALLVPGAWLLWRARLLNWQVWEKRLFAVQPELGTAEKLILSLLLGLTIWQVWIIVSQPMTDYDSLMYHLPNIAQWHSTGELNTLDQFRFTNSRFPFGWEVLAGLFGFPFESDIAVGLPGLLAWALWGIAIVVAGVHLGARRISALSAAALVMVMPLVLENLHTLHVEVVFAALFTAGLCMALLYARLRSPVFLYLELLVCGLLLGTKTSGFVYAVLLMAIAFLLRFVMAPKGSPDHERSPNMLWVGLLCLLLGIFIGAFWYVKNWLLVGNPLGYLQVNLMGVQFFPGNKTLADYARTSLSSILDVTSRADWKIVLDQWWQQFSYPLLAFLISVVALPVMVLWRRAALSRADCVRLLIGAGLTALTAFLYVRTPFTGDTLSGGHNWTVTPWIGQALRFGLPFVSMLAILAAQSISLTGMQPWLLSGVTALAVGATLYSLDSLYALVLGALCFALWLLYGFLRHRLAGVAGRPALGLVLLLAALVLLSVSFSRIREIRERARVDQFNGLTEFVDNRLDANAAIGYMFNQKSYLLYGSDLMGQLVYVDPRQQSSPETLRQELADRSLSLLAVGPVPEYWRSSPQNVIFDWFEDRSSYEPIFGGDILAETVIFRVLP